MTETKTILICEDDPMLSKTLRDACVTEGYAVEIANDGEEGLKMALEKKPHIIFLDIMMPKMDGLTVLNNLNTQQQEPKSKIFMFTNMSETEQIAQALSNGAAGYFVKAQTPLSDILAKIKE